METSLIEQLNKSRYNMLKWITIGWGIWYATLIAKNEIHGNIIIQIAFFFGLLGNTIFIINLVKFLKLNRELKSTPKIKEALEDELHQFNIGKSYKFSYWFIIGFTIFLLIIHNYAFFSALLPTDLLRYVEQSSFCCSSLYFKR